MPVTPNYAFEKRQRELAKKKKLEEKQSRKREVTASLPDTPLRGPDAATEPDHGKATTPPVPAPRIHRKRPG